MSVTTTMPTLSGICQGTCLGLLAFLLCINDLADMLDSQVQFAKFADDIKIWREVKFEQDQIQLQHCLN